MGEKHLFVHSDRAIRGLKEYPKPGCFDEFRRHVSVIQQVTQRAKPEDIVHLKSDQDPNRAANLFEPDDSVTVRGLWSTACVYEAVQSLRKAGIKTTLGKEPYSILPWPHSPILNDTDS